MEVGALALVGRSQLLPTPASLAQESSGFLLGKEPCLDKGCSGRMRPTTLLCSIPEPQPLSQLEAFRKGLRTPLGSADERA